MTAKPIREMTTAPSAASTTGVNSATWKILLGPNPKRVALLVTATSLMQLVLGQVRTSGVMGDGGFTLNAGGSPLKLTIDEIGSAIHEPLWYFDSVNGGRVSATEFVRG